MNHKAGNAQKLNDKRVLQREAAKATEQLQVAIAQSVATMFPSSAHSGLEQQQAANRILHHVVEYLIDNTMAYRDEVAQCIPDVTRLRELDYDAWLDEGRARDERQDCWRGEIDKAEGRAQHVNKERVKLMGRTDTGAWHRALDVAQEALEAGLWWGDVDLWIHDAYALHLEMFGPLGACVTDMKQWTNGAGMHIAVPDDEID